MDADLDWSDTERVRFVLRNLIDAMAPSNNPVLNPAALKAAIDTGGGSALAGLRHFAADMASPPRVGIYRCCPLPAASPSGVGGVGVAASPMWRRWCGRSVLALGRLILPGLTRAHAAMGRQPKGPATRR